MATAQTVLDEFALIYPDCPSATALTLLQQAHDRVLSSARLRSLEEVDILLTSGTQEYAYSDDVLRVWQAYYLTSATNAMVLDPTSIDILDDNEPLWRFNASATPDRWYEVGSKIGLVNKPNTTTSAGYPIVKLFTTKRQTLTTSTTMPAQVQSYDAWTSYMAQMWAMAQDRGQYGYWKDLSANELTGLCMLINGRQVRLKPSVDPDFPTVTNF